MSASVLDLYPWVADKFAGVREDRGGEFLNAKCPLKCHTSAKLRFWIGSGDKLSLRCWAGCDALEVLRAVGLKWADCYPGREKPEGVRQYVADTYPYRDESGAVLYRVVRLEPGRGGRDKEMRIGMPAGDGRWASGITAGWYAPVPGRSADRLYRAKEGDLGAVHLPAPRRVLFQLPEVLAHPPHKVLLVAAGEKDCKSLGRVGVLATTNAGGEGAGWLPSYSGALAGRHVVVVEDRDSAGARHANEVVGSLVAHGAASVRRTALPEKDATAFLNHLRTRGVTRPGDLRRALWEAIRSAPRWVPAAEVEVAAGSPA